jgi:hypothetical protein
VILVALDLSLDGSFGQFLAEEGRRLDGELMVFVFSQKTAISIQIRP